MKGLCTDGKFPFTYDSITDNNPNPSHNIKEFCQNQFVAVEFNIHFIKFRTKKNSNGTFSYKCCLWSVYLINEDKILSTLKKGKQDPDDWVVSALRTKKSTIKADAIKRFTRDFRWG